MSQRNLTANRGRKETISPALDRELKRIVSASLDELKNPKAIPSNVIYAALLRALKLK